MGCPSSHFWDSFISRFAFGGLLPKLELNRPLSRLPLLRPSSSSLIGPVHSHTRPTSPLVVVLTAARTFELYARRRELVSKDVISQLGHTDSLIWVRHWFLNAHCSMASKTVKDVARELFCSCFHGSVLCDGVFAIPTGENDDDDRYNLENISFKRLSEGLADAAGEAEFGKRC
jgi:hypothetical protein